MAASRENIWVGIRIRPVLESEAQVKEETRWTAGGSGILRQTGLCSPDRSDNVYRFDEVFPCSAGAEEVYFAAAKERVQSALQVSS